MPASDETRRKNEIAKKLATARRGTAGDADANAAAKARWQEILAADIAKRVALTSRHSHMAEIHGTKGIGMRRTDAWTGILKDYTTRLCSSSG
jgi:hypothetical protein